MNKPARLRQTLLAHVPMLAADPSKLSLFIDRGRIAANPAQLGFRYAYSLNVVVQDYVGSIDALMVPVLAWIAEDQPDLLQQVGEPFSFESEILDGDSADVSITIELTEGVAVAIKPEGGFDAQHLTEYRATDDFDGLCAVLRKIIANGEVIAESTAPDYVPAP